MINAVASSSGAARMTMPGRSSGRAWWDLRSSCRSDSRLLIAIPFGITLARGQLTAPADEKEILRHGEDMEGADRFQLASLPSRLPSATVSSRLDWLGTAVHASS